MSSARTLPISAPFSVTSTLPFQKKMYGGEKIWYTKQAKDIRTGDPAMTVKLFGTIVYKAELDLAAFQSKGFNLQSWAEKEFSRQRELASPNECSFKQYVVEGQVYVIKQNHFTRKLEVAAAEVVSVDDSGICVEWPESEFISTKRKFSQSEWMSDVFPSEQEAKAALKAKKKS